MKTRIAIASLALLAACASTQTVALYPRGTGGQQASGTLDRINHDIKVELAGQQYEGKYQMQTATSTTGGLYPRTTTTIGNQAAALLLGPGGQVRCEFGFDALMTSATGVCVDSKNITYDMQIKN